jgi:hypothetical protein
VPQSAQEGLTAPCRWWARQRHRARRGADVETLWPALVARADSVDAARVAWEVFLAQPGQDHWHCACGHQIAQLFRHVTITVEE